MKTATEFFDEGNFNNVTDMFNKKKKMHVQEALKQASEKADADFTYLGDDLKEIGAEYIEVYTIKDSILNAYPLDLIK